MANDETEPGHGHSPAAWTAVIIMLVGFAAGMIFFWFEKPIIVGVCAVIVVLGAIVGKIMQKLGYGVGGSKIVAKAHN